MTFEELTARLDPADVAESDRLITEAPPLSPRQLATLAALLAGAELVESRAA